MNINWRKAALLAVAFLNTVCSIVLDDKDKSENETESIAKLTDRVPEDKDD